jgi:hypothetical protein
MTDVRRLSYPRLTRLPSLPGLAAITTAAILAGGCDAEDTPLDYDAVGHIDVRAMRASQWVSAVIGKGAIGPNIEISGDLDRACIEVLGQAEAVTVGTGQKKLEVYVQGPRDSKVAQTCIASLKQLAKDDAARLEARWIADDVLAIGAGPDTLPNTSGARLESLRAFEPSATGGKTAWWVARNVAGKAGIEYVEGWADVGKGFDAHVSVQFDSEAAASKTHGELSLGLTALRLSGEMSELISAVALEAGGDTVTADVHATETQMRKLVARSQSQSQPGKKPGAHGSFKISIGDE